MASMSNQSMVSQSLTFAPKTFPGLDFGIFEVRETKKTERKQADREWLFNVPEKRTRGRNIYNLLVVS